jgi:acyl CoA:acetate/3-ketoacid CoA transferase alpha subunit
MGGFGIVGIPEKTVFALLERNLQNLNIVSNLAGK